MFRYLNNNAKLVVLLMGPSVQKKRDAVLKLRGNHADNIPSCSLIVVRTAVRNLLEPSRTQRQIRLCPANAKNCDKGSHQYISVHGYCYLERFSCAF